MGKAGKIAVKIQWHSPTGYPETYKKVAAALSSPASGFHVITTTPDSKHVQCMNLPFRLYFRETGRFDMQESIDIKVRIKFLVL